MWLCAAASLPWIEALDQGAMGSWMWSLGSCTSLTAGHAHRISFMEAAEEEDSDHGDAIEDPEEPEDSPAPDQDPDISQSLVNPQEAEPAASPPARMPDFRRALQQRRYVCSWWLVHVSSSYAHARYTCPHMPVLSGACTAMLDPDPCPAASGPHPPQRRSIPPQLQVQPICAGHAASCCSCCPAPVHAHRLVLATSVMDAFRRGEPSAGDASRRVWAAQ